MIFFLTVVVVLAASSYLVYNHVKQLPQDKYDEILHSIKEATNKFLSLATSLLSKHAGTETKPESIQEHEKPIQPKEAVVETKDVKQEVKVEPKKTNDTKVEPKNLQRRQTSEGFKNLIKMFEKPAVAEDLKRQIVPSNVIMGRVESLKGIWADGHKRSASEVVAPVAPEVKKKTLSEVLNSFLNREEYYLRSLESKHFSDKIQKFKTTFSKQAKNYDFKSCDEVFAGMMKLGCDSDHLGLFSMKKHVLNGAPVKDMDSLINDLGDLTMKFVMNTLQNKYLNGFLPEYLTLRPQVQHLLIGKDKILKTFFGKDTLLVGTDKYTFEEYIALPSERLTYYLTTLRDDIYTPFFVETNQQHRVVKFSNAINKLEADMKSRMTTLEQIYHMNKFYDVQYHWELDDTDNIPKFIFESSPDETVTVLNSSNEQIACRIFLFHELLVLAPLNKNQERQLVHLNGLGVRGVPTNKIVLSMSGQDSATVLTAPNKQVQDLYVQLFTKVLEPKFFDKSTTQMVLDKIKKLPDNDTIQSYYGIPLEQLYREKKHLQFTQPDDPSCIQYKQDQPSDQKYRTREIACATLPKLVQHLTNHETFDHQFLYSFLLTYRSFATPEQILDLMADRYETPPPQGPNITFSEFEQFRDQFLFPMRFRVCEVIKYWINNHSYDFRSDSKLKRKFSDFIEQHVAKTKFDHLADNLRLALDGNFFNHQIDSLNQITAFTKKRDTFSNQKFATKKIMVDSGLPLPKIKSKFKDLLGADQILDWPSLEIARQITLIEFDLFENIQPKECLSQAWNKPNRDQISPNIYAMMDRTNKMVLWTAQQVLEHTNVNKRAKAIGKLIKVATQLKKINNLNGCKEIVGGLRSIPVARLLKTWELVDHKLKTEFQQLEELLHQRKNFKNMREALRGTSNCTLPYIGMFLTDLTFVEDGNRDTVDGLINYFKRQKYAVVIKEMLRLQSDRYMFVPVRELQDRLKNIDGLSEEQLLEKSLSLEAKKEF
ncbi:RasGefJ [Acrasis kona]|uniref:RasGefJ n=1 Tax=Acrasis kona TaxID=1008807 RepID=A0AAW2ZR42_9EUKA